MNSTPDCRGKAEFIFDRLQGFAEQDQNGIDSGRLIRERAIMHSRTIPAYWRIFFFCLKWILASWSILLIVRLAFLAVYADRRESSTFIEIILQFLTGFRFDLATIPVIAAPILLFAPLLAVQHPAAVRILKFIIFLQIIWLGSLLTVLIASFYNFGLNNKHLGWELFAYLNDLMTVLKGVVEDNFLTGFLYLLIVPVTAVIAFWIAFGVALRTEEFYRPDQSSTAGRIAKILACEFVILVLLAVASRGGLQQSPLRAGDAMKGNAYLASLALNGIFTAIHDSQDLADFKKFYDDAKTLTIVQSLLGKKSDFLSAQYPLLRYMPQNHRAVQSDRDRNRPNIVLVVLESFTAKYLKLHGGNPRIAPQFAALTEEGLYFNNFYASGGRSANGLFCMLAGLPDRAGRTILRSAQIQNRFGGLAALLGNLGYRTFFVHGGDLKFDNLDTALPHLGFQRIIGLAEMDASSRYTARNAWGFDDADTFDTMFHTMKQAAADDRPFFGVVFTLNTHHPYSVPDASYRIFDESTPQHEFLNSFYYSDHALGEFIRKAEADNSLKNTIFVFTADHTSHAGLDYIQDRQIPFLVLGPGIPAGRIDETTGSQLDILPTVLSLAGGGSLYSAMGRDLLSNSTGERFAFFAGGSNTDAIGWIQENRILIKWLLAPAPLFYSSQPPITYQDLFLVDKDRAADYLEKCQSFYQFARNLEKENRIWPLSSELPAVRQRFEIE